uniref:Putative ionotropic receptor 12 n=1 Tax=Conopomorpha sinensis TaxID=940481 RepID=A0A3S7SGN9_9NEOP|nr:putative ionotropic receptor 12 [Conopomorpha sinensis]
MQSNMKILIFLLVVLGDSFALQSNSLKMSLDFFQYKRLKYLCLVVCENEPWDLNMASAAANKSMFVTSVHFGRRRADEGRLLSSCLGQDQPTGVVVSASCRRLADVLQIASTELMLDTSHHWLIINDEEDEEIIMNIFDDLDIKIDAEITVAEYINSTSYVLKDIYNFGKESGGKVQVEKLASWSNKEGLIVTTDKYKYLRRFNYLDHPLKVLLFVKEQSIQNFDMVWMDDVQYNGNIPHSSKVSFYVLKTIAEVHNIKYKYKLAKIESEMINSSLKLDSSSYLHGQDLTPCVDINVEMYEIVDIVSPASSRMEANVYYRMPDTGVGNWDNKFLIPFTPGSWYCVIATMAMCTVIVALSAKLENRPASAQYGFFSVVATLCQQFYEDLSDDDAPPSSVTKKTSIFVTGASCLMIYNYYTSSIVSWLLNGPPPVFNSLEELSDSSLQVVFDDVPNVKIWLNNPDIYFNVRNSETENYFRNKKVFNKNDDQRYVDVYSGTSLIKEGGYALMLDKFVASLTIPKLLNRRETCELGAVQIIPPTALFVGLQKQSPYKEFLRWALNRLNERGHIHYAERRFYGTDLDCIDTLSRALTLGGGAPAFLLLLFGYLVSLVVLLGERLWWRISHRDDYY